MNTLDVHIKKDRVSNLQSRFQTKNSFRYSDNGVTVSVINNPATAVNNSGNNNHINNSTPHTADMSGSCLDAINSSTSHINTSRIQVNNSNGQPQRMRNILTGGGRNYSADNANHIRWEGGKVVHIQDNTIERQHTRGIARELRESRLRQSKLYKSNCDMNNSDGVNCYEGDIKTSNDISTTCINHSDRTTCINHTERFSKVIKITPDEENPSYHVENEELYSKTIEQKLQDIQTSKISKILPMDTFTPINSTDANKWRSSQLVGGLEASNNDIRPRFGTRLTSTLRHRSCSFSTQTRPKVEEHRGRSKLSNFSFRIRSSSVSSFSSSSSSDSSLGSEEFWNQYRRQPSRNIIYRFVRKAISRRPSNVSEYEYKARLPDTLGGANQQNHHSNNMSQLQVQSGRIGEGMTAQQLAARLNELHNLNSNRQILNENEVSYHHNHNNHQTTNPESRKQIVVGPSIQDLCDSSQIIKDL